MIFIQILIPVSKFRIVEEKKFLFCSAKISPVFNSCLNGENATSGHIIDPYPGQFVYKISDTGFVG